MKTLYTEFCSILNPGDEVCNNYFLSAVNCTVGFVALKEKTGSLVTLHKLLEAEIFVLIGNQLISEEKKIFLILVISTKVTNLINSTPFTLKNNYF